MTFQKIDHCASLAPRFADVDLKHYFFRCSVHIKLEEKITLTAGRDGGLKSMELIGMLSIRIADEAFGRIKLCIQVIKIMHSKCLKTKLFWI